MANRYCYITFPNEAIYNARECMFHYYVKKYGYDSYFEGMSSPQRLSMNDYFVTIPEVIANEFIDCLVKDENCSILINFTSTETLKCSFSTEKDALETLINFK